MAEEIIESREWFMAAYADKGVPTSTHLKLRRVPIPDVGSLADGHVVVELLWISIDPYLRTRMTGHEDGLYFPQFKLNEVITAFGIGRVRKSKDERYKEGEVVLHPYIPVAEYSVLAGDQIIRKLDPESEISLPDYLSCFGVPGFAAWLGIEVLGEAKAGCNIFISAAAGGVGMFAGQLAKLKGCRVVGSVGYLMKAKAGISTECQRK